jgi:lipoteichoic acid synthase
MIWIKTYLVQRFGFEFSTVGWLQGVIVVFSPLSSILFIYGIGTLLFRRHSQLVAILISFLSSLILFINLINYRYFNDFITIPMLLQSNQVSSLWSSVIALSHPYDLLIFMDTLALVLIYLFQKKRTTVFNPAKSMIVICLSVMLFSANVVLAEKVRPDLFTRIFDRQIVVKYMGAFNYLIYDAAVNIRLEAKKVFSSSTDLLPAQRFVQQTPQDSKAPEMFGIAKGRNVFLISMESMQDFVINKSINGEEVTPFLNQFIKDSFYFGQFYHQTGQGKTSDAEFIIDTSLYPLASGAVFFTHAHNTYHSTPKLLKENGYYSAVFHANNSSFWNRNQMYKTMGYERFFTSDNYQINKDNSVGWGLKDIPFFEQSVKLIRRLPQPFYCKLITLTNHYPFELNKKDRLIPLYKSNSRTLNRYIPTVRYMDEALKQFFAGIKAEGLYNNSIFILYGDHTGISQKHNKAMAKLLGVDHLTPLDQIQLQRVPLIIHIPGHKGKIIDTVGGQVDLKPTILHLLGIELKDSYNFGSDLFALNKPQFTVLRNNSFITDKYVYTNKKCFDKKAGKQTAAALCDPFKGKALNALKFSDDIIYGDLLRFQLKKE